MGTLTLTLLHFILFSSGGDFVHKVGGSGLRRKKFNVPQISKFGGLDVLLENKI